MTVRPRMRESDLKTIAEALDFYINHLKAFIEKKPYFVYEYVECVFNGIIPKACYPDIGLRLLQNSGNLSSSL